MPALGPISGLVTSEVWLLGRSPLKRLDVGRHPILFRLGYGLGLAIGCHLAGGLLVLVGEILTSL